MEVCVQTRRKQMRQHLVTTLRTQAVQQFRQFRTMLRALRHPEVPWYAKFVCGCAALYVASPIQVIPNFIPIIGQLDDVLVIGLSIGLLKRSVPSIVLHQCRNGSDSPLGISTPLDPLEVPKAPYS